MKLLVDKTLIGYAKPAVYAGFSAAEHNSDKMSTFDIFDSFNPDVYIADGNLLNSAVYKNIEQRPALRVVVIGSEESSKYKEFTDRFSNLYTWKQEKPYADLFEYNKAEFVPQYASHFLSIENTPIDGATNLTFDNNIVYRIFSTNVINSIYYCGFVPDNMKRHFYRSSKISLTTLENSYNVVIAGGNPIIAPITKEMLLNELDIDRTKSLSSLREEILEDSTNFNMQCDILKNLGLDKEAGIIMNKRGDFK